MTESTGRLLTAFRRAAHQVPAYATLLTECGVDVDRVVDADSFARECPVLTKANTFDRFSLDQLSVGGVLPELGDVLTSSGHGGRFSFGVSTRCQMAQSAEFIDLAFDAAFDVKSRKTLTINCLPMGVVFSSNCMTIANVSVREDMAIALVKAFGHRYDQIFLAGDPLFLKRLTDYACQAGVDWGAYRINVAIGEEVFGEHFRGYLARCLRLDVDRADDGYIMSSFGVGELGLHLCYETPATIALRRAAFHHPEFARDLFKAADGTVMPLPMIFTFDPRRTYIEITDRDATGSGGLTISMLSEESTIPLLRYQTGDRACLMDRAAIHACARRHGVALGDLPAALLAIRGREREGLPNGSHVAVYKDALYADAGVARHLTGAVRLIFTGSNCTVHVQLTPSSAVTRLLETAIIDALPPEARPTRVVWWEYERFPFAMRLDYERKFTHFVAGESNPGEPAA